VRREYRASFKSGEDKVAELTWFTPITQEVHDEDEPYEVAWSLLKASNPTANADTVELDYRDMV
jgi:hypothetical protein